MESRVLLLFLGLTLGVGGLTGCARDRLVQAEDTTQPPVIEPDVERREIEVPRSTPKTSRSASSPGKSASRTSASTPWPGGGSPTTSRKASSSSSRQAGRDTELTSFERLSGAAQLLTEDEREYSYYNVSLGYNIFPGEHFIGKNRAMNTETYVIGGVGKTTFAGDDRFTINFGMGMRVMPLDWLAVHGDIRDHVFDIDLLGQKKTSITSRRTLGVTFFF